MEVVCRKSIFAFYVISVRGLFREIALTFSVLEQVKKKD